MLGKIGVVLGLLYVMGFGFVVVISFGIDFVCLVTCLLTLLGCCVDCCCVCVLVGFLFSCLLFAVTWVLGLFCFAGVYLMIVVYYAATCVIVLGFCGVCVLRCALLLVSYWLVWMLC